MAFPVTQSTNSLHIGLAKFMIGTAGGEPVNEVGYTADASKIGIAVPDEYKKFKVNEVDGAVIIGRINSSLSVSADLVQITPDTLALAMGRSTGNGGVAWGRGYNAIPQFSMGLIFTRADQTPIHLRAYYASVLSQFSFEAGKEDMAMLHIEMEALDGVSPRGADWLFGQASVTETLATGAFARNARDGSSAITFVRMSGEGAAADTLTDITGATTLVDGERIRLMVTNGATMPITIDHGAGVIELKDSTDLLMDNDNDWLDLYYDLANTTWKEITRNIIP